MIAVNLTAGEHQITFRYRNKAFTVGLIATIVCALIFWGVAGYVYYPDYKPTLEKWKLAYEKKKKKTIEARNRARNKNKRR